MQWIVINFQHKPYRGFFLSTNDIFNMEIKTQVVYVMFTEFDDYIELFKEKEAQIITPNIMAIQFKYCSRLSGIQ